MTLVRPARRLAAGGIALVALTAFTGAWGTANAGSPPSAAARLVSQMRTATGQTDFSGVVTVRWRTAGGREEQATVDVRSAGGALEVSSGGTVIVDEGDHVFFKDELGWTGMTEPAPEHRPAPDATWSLSLRRGTFVDRPVTVVVASRPDGTPAQRVTIDDATRLPLAREVLAADGTVLRSFRFEELDLLTGATRVSTPTGSVRDARTIDDVPDGYRAPSSAGAGYVLVSRVQHDDGVQLVYSDGLFSVSVREQRGEVNWASMPKGVATSIDGEPARRYAEPMGDVVVWERDGLVFTCVSDAPPDVLDTMLGGLRAERSLPQQVADFVLGPFGFE